MSSTTTTIKKQYTTTSPLRIGVLIIDSVQLLDLSGIDLLHMLSPSYLKTCGMPQPLINQGIPSSITYISTSQKPGEYALCTGNARLYIDVHIDDPSVSYTGEGQDGKESKLDILMIPGPDPNTVTTSAQAFIAGHAKAGTQILCICTGIFALASSGALAGRRATCPRGLGWESKFPDVKWEDARWAHDGNIWTSGGITNGLDMVGQFCKESFPGEVGETVCRLADVGGRGREYGVGKVGNGVGWVWLLLRAWLRGSKGQKGD